nr:probable serine/threonine-protein kinase PIX13 [Tanacetum cinerariifolium]
MVAEVKFLGKFSHPNLVKLIGYCWEDREFLLVYEYMQKGSLESHLFKKGAEPLPWTTRIKIATGAAQGLAFLHTTEKTVIYRDFKSANILLDGDFNAKLSDFGLAKLGPSNGESHVSTGVVGTYGYAAPEYIATGHLYVKSDVYGFGVVLLEIITGLRVLDTNRPGSQHNLVDWARPALPDKRKLRKILDPRLLEHDFPSKGAIRASELILSCLEPDPKNRPSMEEVVARLQEISAIKAKPRETKVHAKQPTGPRRYQSAHQSPLHMKHGGGGRPAPSYPSQSSQRFPPINQLNFDDDFEPLFSQPPEGPSQPVEDDSSIQEVVPVKRKKDHASCSSSSIVAIVDALLTKFTKVIFVKKRVLRVFENKGAGIENGRSEVSRAKGIG